MVGLSLSKIVFMKKRLKEKFGVVGVVAGRYVEAGYSVRIGFDTAAGKVDIIAKKGGQTLVIDVVEGKTVVDVAKIEEIVRKAKSINGKPVLILYGSGPRISDNAREKARELSVELRRIRPS